MKHKHYEMIVAKAANMDLVVFYDADDCGWILSTFENLTQMEHCDFFLCLPQHKEACLHWLNGGELTIDNGKGLGASNYTLNPHHKPLTDFISHPEYTFRIKPKKEKRWIAVDGQTWKVTKAYPSKQDCIDQVLFDAENLQFIEIEVEVQIDTNQ